MAKKEGFQAIKKGPDFDAAIKKGPDFDAAIKKAPARRTTFKANHHAEKRP